MKQLVEGVFINKDRSFKLYYNNYVQEEIEMAQKGDLMTARSDIRVLDATIRDGGLVNNFMFSDDFINALYRTNVKAGVDYMEFGYKASKELFDVNKFGKWKFCDEDDIRAIVGDNNSDLKISVMADVGRFICILHYLILFSLQI